MLGWLSERRQERVITSDLSLVEVIRACRRFDDGLVPTARQLLAGLQFIPLTAEILESAGLIGSPLLRSLDAIHLASALSIRDELSAFVAYDQRLLAAAEHEQLPAIAPS